MTKIATTIAACLLVALACGLPRAAAQTGSGGSLTISSPQDGSTTASSSVLVTGTASDSQGIRSLTVDGDQVAVGSDGSWSAPVNLRSGSNTITAVLTGNDGGSVERQITVNYVPPRSVSALAAPVATPTGVAVTLRCNATAGTCAGMGTLATSEMRRNGKLVSVAGRRRRRVRVGSARFSIAAGATVSVAVPLNPAGRRLLRRFGRLPVRLTLTCPTGDGSMQRIRTGTVRLSRRR